MFYKAKDKRLVINLNPKHPNNVVQSDTPFVPKREINMYGILVNF